MRYLEHISPAHLRIDPDNSRKVYERIDDLADSIAEVGLLQNLVVERFGPNDYVTKAGSRRLLAIQKLVESGRWTDDVLCLVITTDGVFENLTENLCREPVAVWHVGNRFIELLDYGGYTQPELAARLGKTQGHISICVQIARGLAPKVITALDKMGPTSLSRARLLKLAKLVDRRTFEPEEQKQMAQLSRFLTVRRSYTKPRDSIPIRERVWIRFRKLQNGVVVPGPAMPYVNAILRYLDGTDRLLAWPDDGEKK